MEAGLVEAEAAVRAVSDAEAAAAATASAVGVGVGGGGVIGVGGAGISEDVGVFGLNAELFAASDAVDGGAGAMGGGGAEQAALGDAGGDMGATHVWQNS